MPALLFGRLLVPLDDNTLFTIVEHSDRPSLLVVP
jgi:hypothetical protein